MGVYKRRIRSRLLDAERVLPRLRRARDRTRRRYILAQQSRIFHTTSVWNATHPRWRVYRDMGDSINPMTCPHQSQPPGKDTGRRLCALGLYGGKPFLGVCQRCIANGENTPEFARQLEARAAAAHPDGATKISGCCDSALNYLTSPPNNGTRPFHRPDK